MRTFTLIIMTVLCISFTAVRSQNTNAQHLDIWNEANSGDASTKAMMSVFLPEKADGRAVLILPGGGYSGLAVGHEGTDWSKFFNERGIAAFVLEYRMPRGRNEVPLQDVQRALSLIRNSATKWHINPARVGIMGSSAGGHLAASAATLLPMKERPAFQILLYPVISMDEGITHRGSRNNLLGNNPADDLVKRYTLQLQVDRNTPPAILLLSKDDDVVIPQNAIDYDKALKQHNVPVEMHIYDSGGHGWGYNSSFEYHKPMTTALSAWLTHIH